MEAAVGGLSAALAAPVYALPVDIFRILAGLVGLTYFARVFHDAPDLSHHDGLIDHRICRRVFPPTRMSLFHPGLPGFVFRPVFLFACLASVLVLVGYQTKVSAALLFVTAVCTYRWNLFAVYVDDAIVHLTFLWLLLLPVGHTLDLPGLIGNGTASFEVWSTVTVSGGAVRAFLANMALVYLVAGLYKFTSPMWRNGTALHAILKMPIARMPHLWALRHHGLLRAGNYWALIMEPLLTLMFVLPAGSPAKWFMVANAAIFHLGIIATLKIPFANLAMIGAIPVVIGPEIMALLFGRPPLGVTASVNALSLADTIAIGLVAALALMIAWEVLRSWKLNDLPLWRTHMSGFLGNPMYVLLWIVGLAQSYRLFDWIDSRNYHVSYEVFESSGLGDPPRRVDAARLFPRTLRHLLLQSYIVGNVWLQMKPDELATVRRSLLARHARRYARRHPSTATVEVFAVVQRVTSDNLDLTRGRRSLLMRFHCRDGDATLEFAPDGA